MDSYQRLLNSVAQILINSCNAACSLGTKPTADCEMERETLASEPKETVNIIDSKGDFIGGGATGLVERLKSGDIVKSPWPGRPNDCRQEMMIEAQIYERLGSHPRLVQLKHWNPIDCVLTLEYMPNGSLKDYMKKNGQNISMRQRYTWALQATESIELLHSHNVLQGDVGPGNFLLDADLGLKICDFAGSSLDGSRATVAPGVRYRLPSQHAAAIKEDIFALGSVIYLIATSHEPYHDLPDEEEIEKLYQEGLFPELAGVPFAEAIALCWRQEAEAAGAVNESIRSLFITS